jgi:hypothetical protein
MKICLYCISIYLQLGLLISCSETKSITQQIFNCDDVDKTDVKYVNLIYGASRRETHEIYVTDFENCDCCHNLALDSAFISAKLSGLFIGIDTISSPSTGAGLSKIEKEFINEWIIPFSSSNYLSKYISNIISNGLNSNSVTYYFGGSRTRVDTRLLLVYDKKSRQLAIVYIKY